MPEQAKENKMAKVLDYAYESRGSIYPISLRYSSGLYYIKTTHGWHIDATDIAEEVRVSKMFGLTTPSEEKAWAMWDDYVKATVS